MSHFNEFQVEKVTKIELQQRQHFTTNQKHICPRPTPRQKKNYVKKSGYVKDWPFIIPGSKAEGNCQGYENCTNWDPGVRNPQNLLKQGMKTYWIIHTRGYMVQKLARSFLREITIFWTNLRNAIFMTCIVTYIY